MEDLYSVVLKQFPNHVKAGSRMHFPSYPISCVERTLTDCMGYQENIPGGYQDFAGLPTGTNRRYLDDMAIIRGETSTIWSGKTKTQVVKPGRNQNEEAIFLFPVGDLDWVESLYGISDSPIEIGAVALFLDVIVTMYTSDMINAKSKIWYPKTPGWVVPGNIDAVSASLSSWSQTGDIRDSTVLEAVSELTSKSMDAYSKWLDEAQMDAQNGRLI